MMLGLKQLFLKHGNVIEAKRTLNAHIPLNLHELLKIGVLLGGKYSYTVAAVVRKPVAFTHSTVGHEFISAWRFF